jgi:argininosuccinate lyase
MKTWEKNYKLNKKVEKYTVGSDYFLDQKLLKFDCKASIAHVKMLNKLDILTKEECEKLQNELENIIELDKKNLFKINLEDEDCHTAIENYLIKKLGDAGKKIHTARSRNDQVLTALRLYSKDELKQVTKKVENLIKSISIFKLKYGNIILPGYTHMRKAMPSSITFWSDAFIESMQDNLDLMKIIYTYIDKSPLGTGAGYGLPLKVDRNFTANLLGFEKIQNKSLYVQNSRGKFESLILEGLSQIMMDLNKISSDIILFSMSEFGFFEISSEICTGSSIMPHKKTQMRLRF